MVPAWVFYLSSQYQGYQALTLHPIIIVIIVFIEIYIYLVQAPASQELQRGFPPVPARTPREEQPHSPHDGLNTFGPQLFWHLALWNVLVGERGCCHVLLSAFRPVGRALVLAGNARIQTAEKI